MRLKSFFADSIEEAIRQARSEMGPEAMLVNSKRSGPEARHLGGYEVVCASENESRLESAEPVRGALGSGPPIDRLSQDVTELRQQMERLALTLARTGGGMSGIAADPELSRIFAALTDAEVDADLAYQLVSGASSPLTRESLRSSLGELFEVDANLGSRDSVPGAPKIVTLAGPPGSGKTTALIQLAVQYGIAKRRQCEILTLDTYRIAAADQLQSYAAILGAGFQVVETPSALANAIEKRRDAELILIDTPGLAAADLESFAEIAHFVSNFPGMDTHLVAPASMRAADLKRVAQRYDIFRPSKILLTRLDETQTFGPLLSLSARTGKPISFLSRGQRIPEDLAAATKDAVLDMVLKTESTGRATFGTAAA